ncbi:MAG: 3-dehydroquinate synthase [Rickettsiales bacterium]
MTEKIQLNIAHHNYDIIVGDRLINKVGKYISPLLKNNQVIIVSDENVAKLYLHRLSNSLEEEKINFRSLVVPAGESTKSLSSFNKLIEDLLAQNPDRKTTLIALGGGVVGDITGFAASVLLRGVNFIQIPTTLLSQVDSSVGGKTGINSSFGKNLIGSFHQPILVLSDVSTLNTLDKRELASGYAEVVKYGLINDVEFFNWLEKNASEMLLGNSELRKEAIVKSCRAKASIVIADEKERNIRAFLNLGHTFAHAFEAETGYSDELLHGEAVAIGMSLAFKASVKLGICPDDDYNRVKNHLNDIGLNTSLLTIRKNWDINKIMEHFSRDKKAVGDRLTFILTRGIGKAFIASDVNPDIIYKTLQEALSE